MTRDSERDKPIVGLILSGGGARAAYQVGVLKAIAAMLPPGTPNPFPVICGSSAGAINAAALAVYAADFHDGVHRLVHVWRNFRVNQVFRADVGGVLWNGLRWGAALLLGGLGRRNPHALLDRAPLRRLLEARLPCERIRDSLDAGVLRALGITCSGYGSGQSVTFYQGVDSIVPWNRVRRIGCPTTIACDHLMASSALPLIFPAEKINREYFGDGTMRQTSPLSPALHLGAERVLVIGLRQETKTLPARESVGEYPPLAQIAGHVLNSIFLDNLDADVERLQRINRTVEMIPSTQREHGLRIVNALVISPSQALEKTAAQYAHHLPRAVRFLLRGVGGTNRHGANLVSYLLFEKSYCRDLIALGYADAMARREEILRFLGRDGVR